MTEQMKNGKSFEYAILIEFYEKLKDKTTVNIKINDAYNTAKLYFNKLTEEEKGEFLLYASFAIPLCQNDTGHFSTLK